MKWRLQDEAEVVGGQNGDEDSVRVMTGHGKEDSHRLGSMGCSS